MKVLINASLLILLLGMTALMARADNALGEDRFIDQLQMNSGSISVKELATWLLYLAQRHEQPHKRNSEIINSLLGLPKVLNDAGR